MTVTADITVAQVAREHPLSTRVFARHNIDFCCGGGRPLSEVCAEAGIQVNTVISEIESELARGGASSVRWDEKPISALIDHILETYHRPLDEEMPRLEHLARKVERVHGEKFPAVLPPLLKEYLELKADLELHMRKEEEILFPMILQGVGPGAAPPIEVMESEHETAGESLRRIRALTGGFELPDGACNSFRALWAGLEAFERDLHEHIHLENNVLFPRTLGS